MKHFKIINLLVAPLVIFGSEATAQTNTAREYVLQLNTITTAVPFLIITPETRGGGMGDVGVATSPDAASMHWNVAKYAFIDNHAGVSISYTPWLMGLVPDISISYMSGYYRIDKMSAMAGSIRYFSLGQIQFTDELGNNTIQFTPNELALDLGYSRKLSERLSGGLAARYINSNLTGGITVGGAISKPGRTVAVDLGIYYQNKDATVFDKDAEIAWGIHISNLGAKVSYTNSATRDYLPINLRLGPRLTLDLDEYNKISFALDLNKYLVPTPPVYQIDSSGGVLLDAEGNPVIASGMDPNRPVPSGVITSFYDAPGNVVFDNNTLEPIIQPGSRLGEELREINFGIGAEYWYDEQFAFRAGYFWEHLTKGNRKFATVGVSLRLNVFGLDFSYLIPTYFGRQLQTSPLANTLRFTLSFNFAEAATKDNKSGPVTE
ncbi:MAG: type IX secretion system outer membrane channel protein PorV [Salibacteraceae bacterium]